MIPGTLASAFIKAKGFSNVLMHEYMGIDPDLLYTHSIDGVDDLWSYLQRMHETLRQEI